MILYNQFYITYYTGNDRLSLKSIPDNLNPDQRSEYDKLIQSISAIYGSQTSNGNIPKFWTRLVEGTDALGNARYYYEPHPDSTLEYLNPKGAYYFIVRDESSLPLRIPAISGSLLGFTDAKVLPNVIKTTIPNVSLTSVEGNSVLITPTIENLQPYEQYKYEFRSADANWPVNFSPVSGIIKPSTSSISLKSKATFCPSSGVCGDGALNYILEEASLYNQSVNKYAIVQIAINPISYDGPEVLSDQFDMTCSNCLPKPTITLTSSNPGLIVSSISDSLYATYDFDLNLDNLSRNQRYIYNIELLNAQWPAIFIGPSSGIIEIGETSSARIIPNKILLCNSTGICQPGINGVNNYNVPTNIYPRFWSGPIDYDINIRASITSATYSSEYVYSNQLLVKYRHRSTTSNSINGLSATMKLNCDYPDLMGYNSTDQHGQIYPPTPDPVPPTPDPVPPTPDPVPPTPDPVPPTPDPVPPTTEPNSIPSLIDGTISAQPLRLNLTPPEPGESQMDAVRVYLSIPLGISNNLNPDDIILLILKETNQIISTTPVTPGLPFYELPTIKKSDIAGGTLIAKIKRENNEGLPTPDFNVNWAMYDMMF